MTAPLAAEAALIVRRVRAEHEAAGSPDVPALARLWSECEARLVEARAANDHAAGRAALVEYEAEATAAIQREAAGV